MNRDAARPDGFASAPAARRGAVLMAMCLFAVSADAGRNAPTFLDPEAAFKMVPEVAGDKIIGFTFAIAPGYYLYRDRFAATSADATLGALQVPPGQVRFDETFDKDVETHQGRLTIRLPVQKANRTTRVVLTYQGCAEQGLCYPPIQIELEASLRGFGGSGRVKVLGEAAR